MGVFPIDITLYDSDGVRADGFVTYVVAVPPGGEASQMGERLRVSWLWPFTAGAAFSSNGSPDAAVVRDLKPDGRLGRIASLLQSTPLAVTLAPNPETIDALNTLARNDPQLAGTLDALRRGTKAAVSAPYVPLDIPSLVAAGIHSEIRTQFEAGARALAAAGIKADRAVAAGPVDRAALSRIADSGVDRVVVDPSNLAPAQATLTPARPFQLQADGRTLTGAVTDRALADLLLRADAPPALRAQRFLAGLAIVQRELPSSARGVVVPMPSEWSADPATLEAVTLAARALAGSQFVAVVGAGTVLSLPLERTSNRRASLVRRVDDTVRTETPAVSPRDLRTAGGRLDAFRKLVAPDDPRVRRGERALLVSMSSEWKGAAGRRRVAQELAVIDASISQYATLIRGPQQTTVTITARKANIPISFQNDGAAPITVRVRLESEKLFFPQGGERACAVATRSSCTERVITLPPHNTTTRFAVETRASGTFPLVVTVSSADGGIQFQQARFTVRSTVVSGVGLFLTLGAGLFLAGWWGNHYRRRRQGRREARASGSVPVVPPSQPLQPAARGSGRAG
jgi:hypothetical protein